MPYRAYTVGVAVKEKAVIWLHGEVKTPPFSVAARRQAGGLLGLLQQHELMGLPAGHRHVQGPDQELRKGAEGV